jgi:tetratricopeptide (TPR) repeat protein
MRNARPLVLSAVSLVLAALFGCAGAEIVPEIPGKPGVVYLPTSRPGTTFEAVKADMLGLLTGSIANRAIWLRRPTDDSELAPATYYFIDSTTILGDRMVFVAGSQPPYSILFEDLPGKEIAVKVVSAKYARRYVTEASGAGWRFHSYNLADAQRFADDLYFLQQAEAGSDIGMDLMTPAFEGQAANYRAAAAKPQVTEEQRRFIVQANALGQQKDYNGALELYGKALAVDAVAYPEAYYNMALLAAQKGRYRAAIGFMKKYLLLVPDARDARAAQDKIYEWEILMQKM